MATIGKRRTGKGPSVVIAREFLVKDGELFDVQQSTRKFRKRRDFSRVRAGDRLSSDELEACAYHELDGIQDDVMAQVGMLLAASDRLHAYGEGNPEFSADENVCVADSETGLVVWTEREWRAGGLRAEPMVSVVRAAGRKKFEKHER
jgi:hypothetical protein